MDRDGALDVVCTLSDSTHRIFILRYLEGGESRVADICSDLDIPRATVKHNLQRLEEAGLIESVGSTYSVTTYGLHVSEDLTRCLDRIVVAKRLLPFLEVVPRSAPIPDLSVFQDSTVTTVTPTSPHAPTERLVELLEEATYVRVVTPIMLPRISSVVFEGILDRELRVDLIVPPVAFDSFTSQFDDSYDAALDTERFIVGKYPDSIPYGLFRFKDSVAMVGHDEENITRCLVENDSPELLDWAKDRFSTYEESVKAHEWHATGDAQVDS